MFIKEFATRFYHSKEWAKVRKIVIKRAGGMCECDGCESPGYIVHHITELTPDNINDLSIALGVDNLKYVCKKCHDRIHDIATNKSVRVGYRFDDNGDLIKEGWKD